MSVYEISHVEPRTAADEPGGPLKSVVDELIEHSSGRTALLAFATKRGWRQRDVYVRGHSELAGPDGVFKCRKVDGVGEEATLAAAASSLTAEALAARLRAAAAPRSGFTSAERRAYMLEAATRLDLYSPVEENWTEP